MADGAAPPQLDQDRSTFEAWKIRHEKSYSNEEEGFRFQNFMASARKVVELNAASSTATFSLNKFADLSEGEFRSRFLNFRPRTEADQIAAALSIPVHVPANTTVVEQFDWRDHGVLTAVKDQGNCGSCWAFSAVAQLESQWTLAGNPLTDFSPQQLVDCDTRDSGCDGGDTIYAFNFIKAAGGLAFAANYPYTSGPSGEAGECRASVGVDGGAITGYSYATPPCFQFEGCASRDEARLAAVLTTTAPVSVCVDAWPWMLYEGGVLDGAAAECETGYAELNHCVQLVGVDTSAAGAGSTPYWVVRNSWAADWGEGGFIRLAYGANTCGVADEAVLVSIAA